MAETLKLRLVRCPKCENLLQELPDYSICQCRGCGAILRARKGTLKGRNGSERIDEERFDLISDKSDNFIGKSENFLEKSAVSGAGNAEAKVSASDGDGGCETATQKFRKGSKRGVGKWVVEDENSIGNQAGSENLDSKVGKLENQIQNLNGLTRSGRFLESKLSDRGMEGRFRRTRRDLFERGWFSNSYHFGEDSSSFNDSSSSNLGSSYRNQAFRSTSANYVDHDREELLRKLDELKDQLSRVQIVNGKAPEKTPLEHRAVEYHVDYDHPSGFHLVPSQFSASNKHVARPPYFEHHHEPFPVIHGSDVANHNYPTSMHSLNHVARYEDQFESRMFTIPQPRRIHSHRCYMSLEPDPFEPHPYSVTLNQPSCACYKCYARQQEDAKHIPPSAFSNRRISHAANKFMPSHHEVHTASGSNGHNAREIQNLPMGSCDPQLHTRQPSDLNAKIGGFPTVRPQRVILTKENRCHPIAGGTPFVTCHKCFKLLKLPKMVPYDKGEWKMSCGACSSVNSFAIVDGKLVSVDTFASHTTTADDLESSMEVGYGHTNHVKRHNASFYSEDYANSVYDFQPMDGGRVSSSSCQDISSGKSKEIYNLGSVSATTTEDEHFSDDLIVGQAMTSIVEPRGKADSLLPPQDSFDYTSKYRAVSRGGKGSLSSRSDQERIMTNKSTLRHTSLKESLATEMEILDDYADPELSQDSADTYKEDDQQKGKRGVDSFLTGIIKKSFRDLSRSNQTTGSAKRNVSVNGNLIPDRSVKKAEKLAGPIYPGKYWYDHRAGFWGVIGGPCLGIIPPNIQEFNYPMPEKCAGGNTGVFVNGRELHEKDLDLLVFRGLPAARDRSYIIELSGRVVDKDSCKYIANLGKLAPTVEKLKCGFGMRDPEAAL